MALIDNPNKVIYWDEVNWQWLPYVTVGKNNKYYFTKRGLCFPVNCKEDVLNTLKDLNFLLSSLQDLGIIEVSRGLFLYNGKVYSDNGSPVLRFSRFISLISGSSSSVINRKLNSIGVISKKCFVDLVSKENNSINCNSISYKDKSYVSIRSLAIDLGIPYNYMHKYLAKGFTIDKIEGLYKSRFVTDHLGNQFNSVASMLNNWGITIGAYNSRRKRGWSLEKILTTPIKSSSKGFKEYVDFKGRVFSSLTGIAEEYHTSVPTIQKLLTEDKTIEDVTYLLSQTFVEDHLGNTFPTTNKMAKHYGVDPTLFRNRVKRGWSLEEALTGKRDK